MDHLLPPTATSPTTVTAHVELRRNLAMEVEMSSCTRCLKCRAVLYDEELMASWTPDDNNLNATCAFCGAMLVPSLQIYIKDLRSGSDTASPLATGSERASSTNLMDVSPTSTSPPPVASPKALSPLSLSPTGSLQSPGVSRTRRISASPSQTSIPEEKAATEAPQQEEEEEQDYSSQHSVRGGNEGPENLSVPYLSPLVLRKELENVLTSEGNASLCRPRFLDDHPILFWNMLWYFKRLGLDSHTQSFPLSARTTNKHHPPPSSPPARAGGEVCVRVLWDNPRVQEELGTPMYGVWGQRAGQSHVYRALITDTNTFSASLLQQLVTCVTCNDLYEPLKLVVGERRRRKRRRVRHRSVYRDLLCLSFAALGRDNIDHDAFDREYTRSFHKLLQERESDQPIKLQRDDKPPSVRVAACRRAFPSLPLPTLV